MIGRVWIQVLESTSIGFWWASGIGFWWASGIDIFRTAFYEGFYWTEKKKRKMDADAATRTASRDAPIFFGNRPPALALRRLFRRYQPPRPPFAVGQLRSVFHYKNSIFM